ncbi:MULTISPECIES: cyclic pyranopterin monophosphate synthase MoaC [Rathayibacter]|jgi:cyclic pyranopterin phosphate synthase|uniref:Cyclic pyranopterin monophosphate synthase n=1 Tax=Rathayibacter festucae DSM 15932 TaxID=1328866 RepID=A0A3Q9UPW3_9MICO|nr:MULTISPECIES: cyclic pyranopterin monophosphate synthase MoaC [Rathayibacter]AZZ51371.1 cyclic pyranopterin monophosphate synthase MoaC [Rathayibacter festucae DSM 15932]NRG39567.1 cyclic pyranopterin monophosphate synthase MoaC [Rathayibacter sp. VKM Ac-2835]TCL80359.1 cyclic pyranopterin monophosphate synthase subunit MoaC [Rathayibacter sp. PhB192]TCM25885.1 cyclic pyranopterin monophosphate synthase subunit MoaC [Rathayibacter sp. PhB179]TDX78581.1 cyclic pyranopterin phosphate synthase
MTDTTDTTGSGGTADGTELTHVRGDGAVHMVDVGGKQVTSRVAVAEGFVETTPDVVRLLAQGELPKGEALGVARIAGIMGAKATSALIPLCHPLVLDGVDIDLEPGDDRVRIEARVRTSGRTGVEMEALTAVSVAALTVYDMIKAVDRGAVITGIRVLAKEGGRSGSWSRS